MHIPKTLFLGIISQRKRLSFQKVSLWENVVPTSSHFIFGSYTATGILCYQVRKENAFKMPKPLPPLVYLLFLSIFLLAHCDLGDGWFRARMMSNCCQANCIEKEELTCSPFKMIDSVAPHSSSGSSWPALLSPLQGDLVSTACALPATAAVWRLCICDVG